MRVQAVCLLELRRARIRNFKVKPRKTHPLSTFAARVFPRFLAERGRTQSGARLRKVEDVSAGRLVEPRMKSLRVERYVLEDHP